MILKYFGLVFFVNLIKFGLLLKLDDITFFRPSEPYPIENTLQPSEQDVALEEFFWTGSGDGPAYTKPRDPSRNDGKYPNTIVRTATILATVYIDGNYDSDSDPFCVYDCDKRVIESIDQIPPSDRRYWLLTVVAGLFNPEDFPILEEKLAKLYRIAFLRQQAKHLGISNGNHTVKPKENIHENFKRKKRSAEEKVVISPTSTFNESTKIQTRRFEINQHVYERQVLRMKRQRNSVKREVTPPTIPPKILKLPYELIFQSGEKNKSKKFKSSQNYMQRVNVIIHNVVHGDDDKVSTYENKIDVPIDSNNQTEIIYSVIVDGKPVLASTAANDMRLVKLDEVIKIMENDIVLKAEPYLREPQATPLVPSYMNGSNVVKTYINQNPLLITLVSIGLILLIILILALFLFGRSKRIQASKANRQSATQVLVEKINVDEDINTIRSDSLDGGVDNLAFAKEHGSTSQKKEPPVLHFPLPPANRPSSSTSASTSDSSVYYPKRRYKFSSIQDLLRYNDGKSFDKEGDEDIYTKLQTTKTSKKHRQRRKYRTDNRVGSLEKVDVHSLRSQEDAYNDESFTINQEHNEAFNSKISHYNSNKLLGVRTFDVNERKGRSEVKRNSENVEAINKELIQQRMRVKSADTNSIGSFLSMASIKSFPKCTVPEPLSRVLEPVSVTHLDHSDADYDTLKSYRMHSQKSLDFDASNENINQEARAQSDDADPGVVGPVVWEMHRKGINFSSNSSSSPLHDPHSSRNRFEGLLDGAMQLYGSSSYSNCHSVVNQKEDDQLGHLPGVIKSKENRGKSAATIRLTSKTSGLLSRAHYNSSRPLTAGASETQAQKNPVPTIHAWTSGSGSNLVRPLSAGVYHKPVLSANDEEKEMDRLRAMSASPILDAIQKELKKINK